MRHHARETVEQHRELPVGEIRNGKRRAFVRNVLDVHARDEFEQFRIQMHDRALSARAVVERAGPGLGERNEFLDGFHVERRTDRQHVRHVRHLDDRGEIPDRVVGQLGERRSDGVRAGGRHQQRVAIGCALRDQVRADAATGARAVFDHHRLAPALAEFLRDEARDHIGRPGGRKRHQQLYRFGGISLGEGAGRGGRCGDGDQETGERAGHLHEMVLMKEGDG